MTTNVLATAQAKDPNAVKDYTIDWTAWLSTDTIATSTWTVEPVGDLILSGSAHSAVAATIWASGGVVGTRPVLTNRIVTVGGRTDERSIMIPIRDL